MEEKKEGRRKGGTKEKWMDGWVDMDGWMDETIPPPMLAPLRTTVLDRCS